MLSIGVCLPHRVRWIQQSPLRFTVCYNVLEEDLQNERCICAHLTCARCSTTTPCPRQPPRLHIQACASPAVQRLSPGPDQSSHPTKPSRTDAYGWYLYSQCPRLQMSFTCSSSQSHSLAPVSGSSTAGCAFPRLAKGNRYCPRRVSRLGRNTRVKLRDRALPRVREEVILPGPRNDQPRRLAPQAYKGREHAPGLSQ